MEYVQPVGGLANDPYLDANPVGGIEGSPVPAAAIEHPMRELVALIADAGLVPTDASLTQVATAVRALMQKQAASISVAGGTVDAITAAYTPAIAALVNGMTLYVRAASANATATPTFTPASPALVAKTIVKGNNLPLVAGDIAGAGHWVELRYDSVLDKWVIANPAKGIIAAASIQGQFKNLQASATGLSANVSVTCDEIAVESSVNAYQTLRAVNLTIAGTSSGVANGLDTGALAINTWYSVWVIWSGTTVAGLLSLSSTAPTMPAGYTHKARVGWIRTDGTGNKYPLPFTQFGRRVKYKPVAASNLTAWPVMATSSSASNVAIGCSIFVPPSASAITVQLVVTSSTSTSLSVGSNAHAALLAITAGGGMGNAQSVVDVNLETANIYYSVNASAGTISALGWEDNL